MHSFLVSDQILRRLHANAVHGSNLDEHDQFLFGAMVYVHHQQPLNGFSLCGFLDVMKHVVELLLQIIQLHLARYRLLLRLVRFPQLNNLICLILLILTFKFHPFFNNYFPLIALLTFTKDLRAPGMLPFTNSKLRSASTFTISKFWIVTALLPIRPGNFFPLNTRCPSTDPIEPGARWKREP